MGYLQTRGFSLGLLAVKIQNKAVLEFWPFKYRLHAHNFNMRNPNLNLLHSCSIKKTNGLRALNLKDLEGKKLVKGLIDFLKTMSSLLS